MDTTLTEVDLPALLEREQWIWAKTMPGIPHEYIVRGRCRMSDEAFFQVVQCQRTLGRHEVWGRYNFPYLYVAGYKYWTMGDAVQDTIILNRQKVFGEFDSLEAGAVRLEDVPALAPLLRQWCPGGAIFDIGCGDGRLLELLSVLPEFYRGCDPSRNAVARFRTLHPEYAHRVTLAAFEECYAQWIHASDAMVALYGSPSYLMLPYLRMIAASQRPLFLMFYAQDYCPGAVQAMHSFPYSMEQLQRIFVGCTFQRLEHYWVVMRGGA